MGNIGRGGVLHPRNVGHPTMVALSNDTSDPRRAAVYGVLRPYGEVGRPPRGESCGFYARGGVPSSTPVWRSSSPSLSRWPSTSCCCLILRNCSISQEGWIEKRDDSAHLQLA